jgi:CubicO group peptidase (beta-lactamase class C family)
MRRWLPTSALLFLVRAATAQQAEFKDLDAWVEKALKDWQTPGLTLTIVRHDSVLVAKGYGAREAGKPDRVDQNTVFSIGSCSKAFTSAVVTSLVSEKRIEFDDLALKYLPWFRLWDPWVTSQVTVRDLMAHRVGADLFIENRLWPFVTSMRDLVERGGRQQPAVGFRERYRYSNNLFVAAGLVAEAATGKSWAQNVQERLFDPLGMASSSAKISTVLQNPNRAAPHQLKADGSMMALPWASWPDSVLGPTGGINSSAHDMSQWLRFQLGHGAIGGKRLIDSAVFQEMHTPHTPVRGGPVEAAYWFAHVDEKDLQTRFWNYGLAWFVVDYRNRPLVWHGGTINGFRCAIAMLPEEGAGMYVGVNRVSLLPPAVMLTVLDRLIGGPSRDWNAVFLRESKLQADDAAKAAQAKVAGRVPNTRPSLPLSGYAGRFENEAFGPATVELAGDGLVLRVGPFRGTLEHWHYDTFKVTWSAPVPGSTWATFSLDPGAAVQSVSVESLADFVRSRKGS